MTKRLGKDVSKGDPEGGHRASAKGLCDLLIFKHSLKRHLFQRETRLRADDLLLNTDVSFAQWLEHAVEPRMTSYKAWTHAEASGNLTWRAGRTPSEIRWLSFAEETVLATRQGAQLKLVVEAGTSPADALSQGALSEYLAAIGVLHRAEQAAAAKAASGHAAASPTARCWRWRWRPARVHSRGPGRALSC